MFFCIRIKSIWKAAAILTAAAVFLLILYKTGFLPPKARPAAAIKRAQCLTVVLDPGHGGADGGAVSASGVVESTVNLAIGKRLEAMLLLFGVPVVMTRDTENIEYPPDAATIKAKKSADTKARVDLINRIDPALLVSIHQNFYPSSGPSGAQVLYAPTVGSQAFAETLQENFLQYLDPENRRVAAQIQSSIYIMNHIQCPAVLVECGFLSNPAEEEKLTSTSYQCRLGVILAASILSTGGKL